MIVCGNKTCGAETIAGYDGLCSDCWFKRDEWYGRNMWWYDPYSDLRLWLLKRLGWRLPDPWR